jgi:hypothetical protein
MIAELSDVQGVNLKEPLQFEVEGIDSNGTVSPSNPYCQRVLEHFRCPEIFLEFAVNPTISDKASYFRFGSETICYGRSVSTFRGSGRRSLTHDVLDNVAIDADKVNLPFNPTEIIDNLRLEKYVRSRPGSDFLKKIYYLFRPLTSRSMRKQIQRFHARGWQDLNFPRWPVDTTVESICETLLLLSMRAKGVTMVPFVWFWPRGAHGCVTITHDVESQAGMDFCDTLMDVDDSFGVKASFQIVPEERYRVSPDMIDTICRRGFEVGIQDLNHDGRLFDDEKEFLRRAAIVNRYAREYKAKGFRAAVLYRKPEWYGSLDFSYDMSIPNVAHLDPQRGGCCTVTPYFIGKILELPVTATQDYTLFHILKLHSIDLWKTQLELILKKNGLANFIIHPDYVVEPEARSAYEKLLNHLQGLRRCDDIWVAVPGEINDWWRTRSQLRIERSGESWRVSGQGAERATLAYAKNIDGKLVYELPTSARFQ